MAGLMRAKRRGERLRHWRRGGSAPLLRGAAFLAIHAKRLVGKFKLRLLRPCRRGGETTRMLRIFKALRAEICRSFAPGRGCEAGSETRYDSVRNEANSEP